MSANSFFGLARATWDKISDIWCLSSMQYLVTFCSYEAMMDTYSRGVYPASSFCFDLRKWSMEAWSFSRLVLVEIFGLPPSVWSSYNMINIGSL